MNIFSIDTIGYIFMLFGVTAMLIGTYGAVFRMPDFYTRLHAVGVTDSLGLGTLLFGAMIVYGWHIMTAKIAVLVLFLMITGPTGIHAIAGAAYRYDEARERGAFSDKPDGEL